MARLISLSNFCVDIKDRWGNTVALLVEALRYKSEGQGFELPKMSLEFFIDIILSAALWHWGDSTSNRNEYEEYFLGGQRRPVRKSDNLTTVLCRLFRNTGSLSFLETLGPVQACNGIVLPFY